MRFCFGIILALLCFGFLSGCGTLSSSSSRPGAARQEMWVDVTRGEPIRFNDLLDELQQARVIYLGEHHSIARHHELQNAILAGLAERGLKLVLAMEQFEFMAQPALDQFNSGASDLNQLIAAADWAKRWRGYTNYHALLRTARRHDIPVLALNARAETIRAVGRQSLAGITPEQRNELPKEIVTNDPTYEKLLTRVLSVHMAFDPEKLRPIIEAQIARDETMAERLAQFLQSPEGRDRVAVVICGRGHCEYHLGIPDRVARRMPDVIQRVVVFSESDELQLSEAERKQAREVIIPHDFWRELKRLPADFFQVSEPADGTGR